MTNANSEFNDSDENKRPVSPTLRLELRANGNNGNGTSLDNFHMALGGKGLRAQDQIPMRRIVCMRVSGKTMYNWLQEGINVLELEVWKSCAYVIFDNLIFCGDGTVAQGYSHTELDLTIDETVQNTVLYNLETYFQILRALKNKFPLMMMLWTTPSTRNDVYWNMFVRNNAESLSLSLNEFCKKDLVDGLVSDMNFLAYMSAPVFKTIKPMILWMQIGHELMGSAQNDAEFAKMLSELEIDYFIINSFGMTKQSKLCTSHGSFVSTFAAPESSIGDFDTAVHCFMVKTMNAIPRSRILMGMSTTSVWYVMHPWHRGMASSMEIRTLKEVRYLLNFGSETCSWESSDNWCLVQRPPFTISFDSDLMRQRKFDYVDNNAMGGIVTGHPETDLCLTNPSSLLADALRFFGI
jgi:hypothetical protein